MRKAEISFNNVPAGVLEELEFGKAYRYTYFPDYSGHPISLTMPVEGREYEFNRFPPFFDGLLPEGIMLESLLRKLKIDRTDNFSQLVAVGNDLVGAVTVKEIME
ncbi:MAG: HipA N-terminal domain-containing protein [Deltaproteobacteria bacterium]|nr:HipA N-terminal domain-containing protein [Deltaproteobacteria bacterium]